VVPGHGRHVPHRRQRAWSRCKATFATGDGNFVWAEVASDIGTATVTSGNTVNATMLNRFVQALGTKASGSWVLTETITIS
jgi:hypothetical protein